MRKLLLAALVAAMLTPAATTSTLIQIVARSSPRLPRYSNDPLLFEAGGGLHRQSYGVGALWRLADWIGERELSAAGPFLENISGFLYSLLLGFPGLGELEDWPRRSVALPDGWDAIGVDRLWVRRRETRRMARQGAGRALLEGPLRCRDHQLPVNSCARV